MYMFLFAQKNARTVIFIFLPDMRDIEMRWLRVSPKKLLKEKGSLAPL